MIVGRIREKLFEAMRHGPYAGEWAVTAPSAVPIETPKNRAYGHYATNLPLTLGGRLKKPPMEIAKWLAKAVDLQGVCDRVEVVKPGFLNFHVAPEIFAEAVGAALGQGDKFGRCEIGKGQKAQVEFVSANPTGPLSVGHGRIAAFGDALASLLEAAGYDVEREYYVNDVGAQIANLGMSVDLRYRELLGEQVTFGEDGYRGEYLIDYARDILDEFGDSLMKTPEAERRVKLADIIIKRMMTDQARALAGFGVVYKTWFRESSLHAEGKIEETLRYLTERGWVYEQDGATWFASSRLSDKQDRVLKKQSGSATYFLSDIAYHRDKMERNFDLVINIWGADHHGYVERIRSSIEALGYDPGRLEVLIVQLVRFKQSGEMVRMSKRAGNIVTLEDLVEEVGSDVARLFFLMRTKESHLDFDLELAREKSEANPVYYLQYAHARINSLLGKAAEAGLRLDAAPANLALCADPKEISLMKRISDFPWEVESGAVSREPHRIISYLMELAGEFHSFYHDLTVIDKAAPDLSLARLTLCAAVKTVFHNGLTLLGLSAPEQM